MNDMTILKNLHMKSIIKKNNMNRIKTFLFAVIAMMGTTGILTSCQEEAPAINYTMSITVTNDINKVVEAIENGFLKNEGAIKKLTESIDKMNTDQAGKLQSILDVLTNVNLTLDTKLAVLEAAMQAQTLSLEAKLDLLEAAINNLKAEVNAGNTADEAALAQIIQKLEDLKAAMESGGSSTPVFTNTVTLDGVKMPILSAYIDKSDLEEDNWYDIYLFLSEDKKKYVEIMANGKHHNGKTLDLTRKEDEHDGWYWAVEMRNPTILFQTFGKPGTEYPVFLSGTLQVNRIGTGTEFEITLKNGKVKGEGTYGDGLEHTISLSYKGVLAFDEF